MINVNAIITNTVVTKIAVKIVFGVLILLLLIYVIYHAKLDTPRTMNTHMKNVKNLPEIKGLYGSPTITENIQPLLIILW